MNKPMLVTPGPSSAPHVSPPPSAHHCDMRVGVHPELWDQWEQPWVCWWGHRRVMGQQGGLGVTAQKRSRWIRLGWAAVRQSRDLRGSSLCPVQCWEGAEPAGWGAQQQKPPALPAANSWGCQLSKEIFQGQVGLLLCLSLFVCALFIYKKLIFWPSVELPVSGSLKIAVSRLLRKG